jgi:hypothetical protein
MDGEIIDVCLRCNFPQLVASFPLSLLTPELVELGGCAEVDYKKCLSLKVISDFHLVSLVLQEANTRCPD